MVPGLWMLSTHDGKKAYVPNLELKPGGYTGFGGNQRGKIIGSGTVGNGNLPSINNVLLVDGLMHNLLSISQLSDNGYEKFPDENIMIVTDCEELGPYEGPEPGS